MITETSVFGVMTAELKIFTHINVRGKASNDMIFTYYVESKLMGVY